jgi:hypothetical protein
VHHEREMDGWMDDTETRDSLFNWVPLFFPYPINYHCGGGDGGYLNL